MLIWWLYDNNMTTSTKSVIMRYFAAQNAKQIAASIVCFSLIYLEVLGFFDHLRKTWLIAEYETTWTGDFSSFMGTLCIYFYI